MNCWTLICVEKMCFNTFIEKQTCYQMKWTIQGCKWRWSYNHQFSSVICCFCLQRTLMSTNSQVQLLTSDLPPSYESICRQEVDLPPPYSIVISPVAIFTLRWIYLLLVYVTQYLIPWGINPWAGTSTVPNEIEAPWN